MTNKINSSGCFVGLLGGLLILVYIIWFILDNSIAFWPAIIGVVLLLIGWISKPKSSSELHTDLDRSTFNISMKGRDNILFDLKGVHLEMQRAYILNFCKQGDIVTLRPEPTNKYDSDAIQVFHDNFAIGYVPSEDTYEVHEFMNKYNHIAMIYKRESSNGFLTVEIGVIQY